MLARMIFATWILLASTTAWAQSAPRAEKTTEDHVCQLSGTCASEVTLQTESDAAQATDAKAESGKISREFKSPAATRPAPAINQPSDYFRIERKSPEFAPGRATDMPEWRADLRVSFVAGSAELTPAGRREAQKFASALGSPPFAGLRITIEGHTNAVGARGFNFDLSKRRAQAVVDYLVAKGADRSRFNVVGYGFDRPLEGRPASDAANRRVEVVLVK